MNERHRNLAATRDSGQSGGELIENIKTPGSSHQSYLPNRGRRSGRRHRPSQGLQDLCREGAERGAADHPYLVARRNLWPTIIGHGLVNTFGITVLHLQATGAINTSGLG